MPGGSMQSHTHYLWFNTKLRQEIIDVTDEVAEQVRHSGVREGFVLVSAMHITASVFVNDHESGLWQDILVWLERTVAPWDPGRYRHNATGEDNAAGGPGRDPWGAGVTGAPSLPAAPATTDRRPLLTNALRREPVATHIVPEVPCLRRSVPLPGAGAANRMPAPFGRADLSTP